MSGEHLSVSGGAVNDCHAEVVARRCLCEYLYKQLELHTEDSSAESILEPVKKGFKLKQGIQFHLYINTAPCGDARIFSPHEENESVDKHPNRRARGQLRTKIESGEGTIPVKSNEGIQTWDGVLMVRLSFYVVVDDPCKKRGDSYALLTHVSMKISGSKTADDVVFGQNSSMERTWCARRASKPLHRANLLPQHCSRQSFEPQSHVQGCVRPYRKYHSRLATAVQAQQTTDEFDYIV